MNDLYGFDDSIRKEGFTLIAGVDEAGRGSLAGPVVAAAVTLPESACIDVKDSKLLTPEKRKSLFEEIKTLALSVGVGIVSNRRIDQINIYQATIEAMLKSVNRLSLTPEILIIDAMRLPIEIPQISLVGADSKSASVAAASIVAKVIRDRIMEAFHRRYPSYGFDRHKGYCTTEHLRQLRRFGPCPIHRQSYSPVRQLRFWDE